ncbi:7039_t:CDS:2, partial [Scutellospora calospora]
ILVIKFELPISKILQAKINCKLKLYCMILNKLQSDKAQLHQNNIKISNLDSENNQSFFKDTEEFLKNIEIEEFLDKELDNELI